MHRCHFCHEQFSGRKRKYCCASCREAAKAGHDPAGHQCQECGARFSGRKKKYCSGECAHEAHATQTRIARSGNTQRKYRRPARIEGYPEHVVSEAQRRRWRYQHDLEYRARELARHYCYRARRRLSKRISNDGTVGPEVLRERDTCLYCGAPLDESNRTLDHMAPLSLGGAHSASNVTPCCLSCNSSKQAMPFGDWLLRLSEPHRSRARSVFHKKIWQGIKVLREGATNAGAKIANFE